jgi:hypothetical protein
MPTAAAAAQHSTAADAAARWQGGPYACIFNPKGSKPLAAARVIGTAKIAYDSACKSQIAVLQRGGPGISRFVVPPNTAAFDPAMGVPSAAAAAAGHRPTSPTKPKHFGFGGPAAGVSGGDALVIQQPIIVLQILIPLGGEFNIEFSVLDRMGHYRINFSTSVADVIVKAQHAKLPLQNLPRNMWLELAFHVPSIFASVDPNRSKSFRGVEGVAVGPACSIRRIYTLRDFYGGGAPGQSRPEPALSVGESPSKGNVSRQSARDYSNLSVGASGDALSHRPSAMPPMILLPSIFSFPPGIERALITFVTGKEGIPLPPPPPPPAVRVSPQRARRPSADPSAARQRQPPPQQQQQQQRGYHFTQQGENPEHTPERDGDDFEDDGPRQYVVGAGHASSPPLLAARAALPAARRLRQAASAQRLPRAAAPSAMPYGGGGPAPASAGGAGHQRAQLYPTLADSPLRLDGTGKPPQTAPTRDRPAADEGTELHRERTDRLLDAIRAKLDSTQVDRHPPRLATTLQGGASAVRSSLSVLSPGSGGNRRHASNAEVDGELMRVATEYEVADDPDGYGSPGLIDAGSPGAMANTLSRSRASAHAGASAADPGAVELHRVEGAMRSSGAAMMGGSWRRPGSGSGMGRDDRAASRQSVEQPADVWRLGSRGSDMDDEVGSEHQHHHSGDALLRTVSVSDHVGALGATSRTWDGESHSPHSGQRPPLPGRGGVAQPQQRQSQLSSQGENGRSSDKRDAIFSSTMGTSTDGRSPLVAVQRQGRPQQVIADIDDAEYDDETDSDLHGDHYQSPHQGDRYDGVVNMDDSAVDGEEDHDDGDREEQFASGYNNHHEAGDLSTIPSPSQIRGSAVHPTGRPPYRPADSATARSTRQPMLVSRGESDYSFQVHHVGGSTNALPNRYAHGSARASFQDDEVLMGTPLPQRASATDTGASRSSGRFAIDAAQQESEFVAPRTPPQSVVPVDRMRNSWEVRPHRHALPADHSADEAGSRQSRASTAYRSRSRELPGSARFVRNSHVDYQGYDDDEDEGPGTEGMFTTLDSVRVDGFGDSTAHTGVSSHRGGPLEVQYDGEHDVDDDDQDDDAEEEDHAAALARTDGWIVQRIASWQHEQEELHRRQQEHDERPRPSAASRYAHLDPTSMMDSYTAATADSMVDEDGSDAGEFRAGSGRQPLAAPLDSTIGSTTSSRHGASSSIIHAQSPGTRRSHNADIHQPPPPPPPPLHHHRRHRPAAAPWTCSLRALRP